MSSSAPRSAASRSAAARDDRGLLRRSPGRAAPATRRMRRRSGVLRWLFNGSRPEPLPVRIAARSSHPKPGKLGICCSGGGIRSAAFSLGALQALQESGELQRASYLAAVSGGSYIAAAISMVAKTGTKRTPTRAPARTDAAVRARARRRSSTCATAPPTWRPTLADMVYLGLRIVLGLLFNLALHLAAADRRRPDPHRPRSTRPSFRTSPGTLHGDRTAPANLPVWFWIAPARRCSASAAAFGLATLLFRWRKERLGAILHHLVDAVAARRRRAGAAPGRPALPASTGSTTSAKRAARSSSSAIDSDRLDRRRLPRAARRGDRPARARAQLEAAEKRLRRPTKLFGKLGAGAR